tara:strand:- start:857 stop:2629 length:1773 start_codon:yes stop_codon:yes gene_type:complete
MFNGNESLSDKKIELIVRQKPPTFLIRRPEFNSRLVKLDALTIEKFYNSNGFINANVKEQISFDGEHVDIRFDITEGRQYFISKISVSGNNIISTNKILSIFDMRKGDRYNPSKINENGILIENEYHENGKLFLSMDITDIITDSVEIEILINEGKFVSIQNTSFDGLGKISRSQVKRELMYSLGDIYKKSLLDRSKSRLRETGVFSMVNYIPIKITESDSIVDIKFDLKPFKQYEWISEGGYSRMNFLEGLNLLEAMGITLEWKNRSIFRSPTQFSTKIMGGVPLTGNELISDLNKQEFFVHFDAGLTSNWIFNLRLPTKLSFFFKRFKLEEQNEISQRYGLELSQKLKLSQYSLVKSELVWQSFSGQSVKSDNNRNFEIVEQRSIAFIIQRDRRDDPIYTKKGYFISSKVKSSGYQLGGERDYIKFDYTLQSYLPIGSNSVFAKRFKFGRIWGWDNKIDDVAREKFYLGGSNTMRGWNFPLFKTSQDTTFQNDTLNILITEVPKGDLVRFMTNIEYRLPVYESFGLTLFADGAVLENNLEKINLDYLEWNLGIGITIKTPLGPARLDYAFKPKSPNRGIIQLGLQNLF